MHIHFINLVANCKEIEEYMQLNTRNKIVFCTSSFEGINFVDAGYHLSLAIQSGEDAVSAVSTLFGGTAHHPSIGLYLALKNIGILFEPELKLNLRDILLSYSKNQCLIILDDPDLMPLLNLQAVPYVVLK